MSELCTFRIGDLALAVDSSAVQEVLLPQSVTSIPLAPSSVAGLLHLRGSVVTALDLRHRLGLEPRPAGTSMGVVLRGEERVCLLVDDIGSVHEAEAEGERPPETLPSGLRNVARAMHLINGVTVIELDAEKACAETQP